MNNRARSLKRGECHSPTDVALLGNPLDFFHEDHLREREICAALDRIAVAEHPDAKDVIRAMEFLRDELPLHLADEEQDLFPLLRRRCTHEDEIDKVIAQLTADHVHAGADTPVVVKILECLDAGQEPLSGEDRAKLVNYAVHARRHLILENAIVLPFAKLRLTKSDLETLTLRMLQRRGLDQLKEAGHAE